MTLRLFATINNFATKYLKFYLLTEVVAVGGSDAD